MEVFWIVVGVVVVFLFLINQNRTKVTNRTEITRNRTVKTDDGEITIRERQVIDSTSTKYTRPNTINNEQPTYDKTVISDYYKQVSQQNAIESLRQNQPHPATSVRPAEKIVNPLPRVEQKQIAPKTEPVQSEQRKICTRCSRNLPLDKFRKSSKSHHDGYTTWCAHCLDGPKNTRHTKWCPICEIRRKRTSYYKNTNNADGLMSWCKSCWDSYRGRS